MGDKVVPNMKNFDGTDVLEPKNWTIVKERGTGSVTNNGKGKAKYSLGSNKTDTGTVTLADKSWTGENKITFENTSIKGVGSDKVMFANQTLDTPNGMSDTAITFKGNNFLYEDGGKSRADEKDAVHFHKNLDRIPGNPPADIISHTKFVSEPGSALNMYVKSGSGKSRGIGVTQYKESVFYVGKKYYINQTEMEFHGAVNIKIERGNQNRSGNYGIFGSNTTKKKNGIGEPEGSYNKIKFYSDVKIDVKPVLDENGKQKSIGDVINVDGKYSHIGISGDGKVQIDGDIHVINGGTVDLNLKNKDSYINGEIHIGKQKYGGDLDGDQSNPDNQPSGQNLFEENRDDPDPEKNTTKLTLNMSNGTRWNATNTSKINDLAIDNEAEITFGSDKRFINISTGTLKGNGIFHMSGDIAGNKSDRLIIRKSSEGHHQITYKDNGAAKTTGNESLLLVEYKTDNKDDIKGGFTMKHGKTGQGAYEYVLTEPAGSKIVQIEPGHNFYLNPTGRLASAGQSSVLLNDLIYQSNLTLTESLHQRLGEVHFNKDLVRQKDVWVKYLNGKYSGDRGIKVGLYVNRYRGLKIGHDWAKERGNWINYNGISLGYISSNAAFKHLSGQTSIDGRELGLYSAWLNKENDLYLDFFAKAVKYRGRYEVKNSETTTTSPQIRTLTYILSAETGRRFNLNETEERTSYIQPEAQLTYHTTGGYAFKASSGLDIKTERVRSLTSRIGFRAGLDYVNEKNLHPYAKLMYEREFLGGMQHSFNEAAVEKFGNKGHWWVYGLGLSYMDKAKNTQLYFETQRSTRHYFKQNWQAHLGVRHLF